MATTEEEMKATLASQITSPTLAPEATQTALTTQDVVGTAAMDEQLHRHKLRLQQLPRLPLQKLQLKQRQHKPQQLRQLHKQSQLLQLRKKASMLEHRWWQSRENYLLKLLLLQKNDRLQLRLPCRVSLMLCSLMSLLEKRLQSFSLDHPVR